MNLYDMSIYEQVFNNDIERLMNWFYFKNIIFPIAVIVLLTLILIVLWHYTQRRLTYMQTSQNQLESNLNLSQQQNINYSPKARDNKSLPEKKKTLFELTLIPSLIIVVIIFLLLLIILFSCLS